YFSQFDKSIDNVTFFTRLKDAEDDLADWFDDVQYVKSFFGTSQKGIFDDGINALEIYQDVKHYVETPEVEKAMKQLEEIIHDPIPYGKIKDIYPLVNILTDEINKVLETKKEEAKEKVQVDFDEASLKANQYGVSTETQKRIKGFYEDLLTSIEAHTDIYKVD